MKIQAKAPCRVDLAGGTLDIWPLYLFHENAVTVNFAVDRYTSCELITRDDAKIVLRSADQKGEEAFENYEALAAAKKYKLPLLAHIVRFFHPPSGIELSTDSEAPSGAGISGSSSLLITTGSALNKLTGASYNIEKIREIAQNVEAQIINVPTGCQDYYPAMYGGVSAIDLTAAGIKHNHLPLDLEDFNRRIVLAYSGKPRNSGINNWEVTKAHIDGDQAQYSRISSALPRSLMRCGPHWRSPIGTKQRGSSVRSGLIAAKTLPESQPNSLTVLSPAPKRPVVEPRRFAAPAAVDACSSLSNPARRNEFNRPLLPKAPRFLMSRSPPKACESRFPGKIHASHHSERQAGSGA